MQGSSANKDGVGTHTKK